jgi:hypothetical protein
MALALLLIGCTSSVSSVRIDVTGANALFGGGGHFCAQTASDVWCWSDNEWDPPRPVKWAGAVGATAIATTPRDDCALVGGQVWCATYGAFAKAAVVPFDAPTALLATGGYPNLVCVLDAAGVSCWGGDVRTPQRMVELGHPNRLVRILGGSAVCGVYADGTRCYPYDIRGHFDGDVLLAGMTDPAAIALDATGGHALVVEGAAVRHGSFRGTLDVVGNVFATNDPLAVDFAFHPLDSAVVQLVPVDGVGPVKAVGAWSIFPMVLDDTGVKQLAFHGDGVDVKPWPTEGVPTGLWAGPEAIYTRDGDTLHERYRHHGYVDAPVAGIEAPVDVVVGMFWTCALEAKGGVACVKTRRT